MVPFLLAISSPVFNTVRLFNFCEDKYWKIVSRFTFLWLFCKIEHYFIRLLTIFIFLHIYIPIFFSDSVPIYIFFLCLYPLSLFPFELFVTSSARTLCIVWILILCCVYGKYFVPVSFIFLPLFLLAFCIQQGCIVALLPLQGGQYFWWYVPCRAQDSWVFFPQFLELLGMIYQH